MSRATPTVSLDPAVLLKAFVHAPVGVGVCDADGRFLAVNDALARLLDRPTSHIVGRPFLTFVHPEQRAASLASYFVSVVAAATQPPRRPEHAELRCLTGRGAFVWLAVTWTITEPDAEGYQYGIVHFNDVTERREVQRQVATAQQRFQLAFDCAPIGIAVVGADGVLLQANRALQTMLGYEQLELVGSTFATIFHPRERKETIEAISHLLSGQPDVVESVRRLHHRDGQAIQARCIFAAARDTDGALNHLLVQLEDLTSKQLHTDRLDGLAIRDRVTGLPTEQVMAAQVALTGGIPRSLIVIEVPDLPTAEAIGATGRERLLAQLAHILLSCCRDGDLLARVSDNEFGIVVEDNTTTTAETVAERVAEVLRRLLAHDATITGPAIQVGIDSDETGTRRLSEMLHRARTAKGTSAPRVKSPRLSNPTRALPLSRVLAMDADLGSAIRRGGLSLVYQPIVDLSDGSIHSAEALSRWNHPVLGSIPPADFIPIAERSATIHSLTAWALRAACADLAEWKAARITPARMAVAVNISALSFTATDFPTLVIETVEGAGLQASDLILEITETAATDPTTTLLDNAERLNEIGVRIALDDFGAGHSSLARLATIPIAELKMDRTLMSPALDPGVSAALLRATVSLAGDLGIDLVAEGIETPAQFDLLRRHGCPYAQGNLLAVPRSSHDLKPTGFLDASLW